MMKSRDQIIQDFERTKRELKQERRLEKAELENTCYKIDQKINAHNAQVMKLIRQEHLEWRKDSLKQLESLQRQIAETRLEAMEFRQRCVVENDTSKKMSERSCRYRMLQIDLEHVARKLESLRVLISQQKLELNGVIQIIILNLKTKFETIFFELNELKKVDKIDTISNIEEKIMDVHDKVAEIMLELEIDIIPRFDESMLSTMKGLICTLKDLEK